MAVGLTIFEISDELEVQYVDGRYIPVTKVRARRPLGMLSPHLWTYRRHIPSGRLCVRAASPYEVATWERHWREAKRGELTSRIPQIAEELESAAVTIAKLVEEGERRRAAEMQQWEVQQEKWSREEAERRRAREIKEAREQLFAIVDEWNAATQIEGFFADAERRAKDLSDAERSLVVDRLRDARALLGGVDALQRFLAWKTPPD